MKLRVCDLVEDCHVELLSGQKYGDELVDDICQPIGSSQCRFESIVEEHFLTCTFAEFVDLFLYVSEECIGQPPAQEHDCVHRLTCQIHHHCESGSI
eukprot:scaffold86951_cov48-Cyclotella_meneghiniana.AAC.3